MKLETLIIKCETIKKDFEIKFQNLFFVDMNFIYKKQNSDLKINSEFYLFNIKTLYYIIFIYF